MKRMFCTVLALLLALGFSACATPVASETPAPEIVAFNDAVLEAKVREAMGKSEGDITLEEAQAVTELDFSNEWQANMSEDQMIKDISALEYFPNLTKLVLTFNAVTDISVLSGMSQLRILDLGGNQVDDLSPISDLVNLVNLSLFGNSLTDIGALTGLTNVDTLFIHANQISDIDALFNMKKLNLLMAQDNQIKDISALEGLPLNRLFLANNPIEDYSPIEAIFSTLEEKDFEILTADAVPDEPLVFADAQFEKALRNAMDIHDRPITQKDAFMVQSIYIGNDKSKGSQFADISPLSYFVNLTSLEFNSNLISDLTPLSGLTKLKKLGISYNQVSDISPLQGLTQLESLLISFNQIIDISALKDMANLRELWLDENQVVDVSALSGLVNLQSLQLANNPIADYSPLKDIFPKLTNKDFEMK